MRHWTAVQKHTTLAVQFLLGRIRSPEQNLIPTTDMGEHLYLNEHHSLMYLVVLVDTNGLWKSEKFYVGQCAVFLQASWYPTIYGWRKTGSNHGLFHSSSTDSRPQEPEWTSVRPTLSFSMGVKVNSSFLTWHVFLKLFRVWKITREIFTSGSWLTK